MTYNLTRNQWPKTPLGIGDVRLVTWLETWWLEWFVRVHFMFAVSISKPSKLFNIVNIATESVCVKLPGMWANAGNGFVMTGWLPCQSSSSRCYLMVHGSNQIIVIVPVPRVSTFGVAWLGTCNSTRHNPWLDLTCPRMWTYGVACQIVFQTSTKYFKLWSLPHPDHIFCA